MTKQKNNEMKRTIITLIIAAMVYSASGQKKDTNSGQRGKKADNEQKYNPLTEIEEYVILRKGTERPFTGKYYKNDEKGTYVCKRCGAALYKSSDKFDAHCGWPSFDDEIEGAVNKTLDADGIRTEITCVNCGGHLGHVFYGEEYTQKNTRHCVNSVSLDFIPSEKDEATKRKRQTPGVK